METLIAIMTWTSRPPLRELLFSELCTSSGLNTEKCMYCLMECVSAKADVGAAEPACILLYSSELWALNDARCLERCVVGLECRPPLLCCI